MFYTALENISHTIYLNSYDHFLVHGQVQNFVISTSLLSIAILDHKVTECIFYLQG